LSIRIVCGEKKHPGGKLVRICLRLVGDRVRGVLLSGDFFADPEEEVEKLVERLMRLETSIDEAMEAVLREFRELGAEIYGIEVSDVEEAVRRALASAK